MDRPNVQFIVAIAWCLAWGEDFTPRSGITLELLQQMRQAVLENQSPPAKTERFVTLAQQLQSIPNGYFPEELVQLKADYAELWQESSKIGLVYGGATKIKQYVFEAAKLSDIRGASALLDRINLEDIPAFFGHPDGSSDAADWLEAHFLGLRSALIPELLVYYKGGSILAFCPAAWVDRLADAIEKRYTHETLTANSCAVGDRFKLLEIRLGLLQDPIEKTLWFDNLQANWTNNSVLRAYFCLPEPKDKEGNLTSPDLKRAFSNRKNFNELVGKLATQFNQRRSGFDIATAENKKTRNENNVRPTRRYPPMFETHPYLMRDDSDRRSAVVKVSINELPDQPKFSESLARKRITGQVAKRENSSGRWYFGPQSPFRQQIGKRRRLVWKPDRVDSWVTKFKQHLNISHQDFETYYRDHLENTRWEKEKIQEARSLREIGDASDGFVAYIYADGNNMGHYIRNHIKTPAAYEQFSNDIFEATEQSVYCAIAQHLKPHLHTPDSNSNRTNKNLVWIHPFEIVTIGGDDVLLIVPANKALAISKTLCQQFELFLERTGRYSLEQLPDPTTVSNWHRYQGKPPQTCNTCLSISSGVLITADDTPIYYAEKLVNQLLKSAKKKTKSLKGYTGGTVDILTLKAVTMISSNIETFRQEGLTFKRKDSQVNHEQLLKLYATPYTLHELDGLLDTLQSLKDSKFPLSQLYQIRELLERGKRTSILNYRYFRVRLSREQQKLLQEKLETAWCEAQTNGGNVAPWVTPKCEEDKTVYETIWRELVELLPFVNEEKGSQQGRSPSSSAQSGVTS